MAIVVDAHSDILNDIHPRRILGEREVLKNDWVPKMKKGGIDIRVVALYSDIQYLPELALRRGLDLVETLYEEIEECPDAMLCTTYSDMLKAKEEGKVGFILGMVYGFLIGMVAQLRYSTIQVAVSVGLAVISSMSVAALVGSLVPMGFARVNIDPAVATGPFVTTAIDIISVYFYFEIATTLLGI